MKKTFLIDKVRLDQNKAESLTFKIIKDCQIKPTRLHLK